VSAGGVTSTGAEISLAWTAPADNGAAILPITFSARPHQTHRGRKAQASELRHLLRSRG
jgi:hypothetical protein